MLVAGWLGTVALTAADAPADAPPRDRPARPDRQAGGMGMGGGRAAMGGWLDDQQRELLRDAMQKDREAFRKLDESMRTAQRELTQAILAEKPDEKVVREKAEAVAKLQVEQTVLRAKAFSAVVPTLKPEQRDQIESSPWAIGMLMGGPGGMRPFDRAADPGRDRPLRRDR